MSIRDMTNDDLFDLLEIIGNTSQKAQKKIAEAVKIENHEESGFSIISAIVSTLMVDSREEIKRWLGNFYGVDASEFGKMPLSATTDIIKSITGEGGGLSDFLSQCYSVLPTSVKGLFGKLKTSS